MRAAGTEFSSTRRPAGVIDQNMNRPDFFDVGGDFGLEGGRIGEIGGDGPVAVPADARQFRDDLPQGRLIARHNGDGRPEPRQFEPCLFYTQGDCPREATYEFRANGRTDWCPVCEDHARMARNLYRAETRRREER